MSKVQMFQLVIILSLLPFFAVAQHKGINFQAVIKKPDGTYPSASGLTVTLQILDPVTNCVLREEEHTGKNVSNGYLNLIVGDASANTPLGKNPTPVLTLTEVMDNSKQRTGLKCVDIHNNIVASNQAYSPTNVDRRVLRVRLNIQGDEVVADFNMRAVAFAVNSEMLNSKTDTDFVNINTAKGVTKDNVESVFERFTKLDSLLNSTKLDGLLTRTNAAGDSLAVNVTGNAATATTIAGGIESLLPAQAGQTGKYLRTDGSSISWESVATGGGGLSQIGISLPASVFTNGADITANGQVSATFTNQNANMVFAGPSSGSASVPTFRALTASDIPSLTHTNITGTLSSGQIVDPFVASGLVVTGMTSNSTAQVLSPCLGVVKSAGAAFSCGALVASDIPVLTTSHLPDGSVSDVKIGSVSGTKITGTVSSGNLPVAGSGVAGIVNAIAQSFSGLKEFLNGIKVVGNAEVTGALSSASLSTSGSITSSADMTASGVVSADRIRVANSSATCDSATEGSLKYNSASKKMEYCNGTAWTQISQGTQANLSIGAPSSSLVKSGPVTFDVTYGSGADTATISLDAGDITLGGTATTGCSVTGVTGAGSTRTITVNGCAGSGTVNISIAAGTANSTTGDAAPAAGPSTPYNVDNTGPTAPTGVSLGTVPSNLTNSPTITYTAASDVGGSTVANHQIKIIKTSDSSLIKDWSNHTSGSDVGSLTLETNTQYSVTVRAVDALGNTGTLSGVVNWISISDPCLGGPAPGTICMDGTYYLGTLGGFKYKTTPGNCTNSATPTCDNQPDGLVKVWANGTGTTAYGDTGKISETDGQGNSSYLATNYTDTDAAKYCENMTYAGHSDWFLPAKDELYLFLTPMDATQRGAIGIKMDGTFYWSSSEKTGFNGAWSQRFSDGAPTVYTKNNSKLVRCVRKF